MGVKLDLSQWGKQAEGDEKMVLRGRYLGLIGTR
jgi:hypothetical protein